MLVCLFSRHTAVYIGALISGGLLIVIGGKISLSAMIEWEEDD